MSDIKISSLGWKDKIADGFTALNLQRVIHAISSHIKDNSTYGFNGTEYRLHCRALRKSPPNPVVIIGHDSRFMSEHFARHAAGALANKEITVKLVSHETSIPAVAKAVVDNCAVGGIVICGHSHGLNETGLSWLPFWGGMATEDVLLDIETRIPDITNAISKGSFGDYSNPEKFSDSIEINSRYYAGLSSLVDLKTIKKASLKIGLDAKNSSIRTSLRPWLEKEGLKVSAINEERDVSFGNVVPEFEPEDSKELADMVKRQKLDIGLATDGRLFSVIDSDGKWISPNVIFAIILEHLLKNRGLKGKVSRSVFTSHFIDLVAKAHNREIRETKSGCAHITQFLRTDQFIMGCDETGGFAMQGHVPACDGILAFLLLLEKMAVEKKSLSKLVTEIKKTYKEPFFEKTDMPTGSIKLVDVTEKLRNKPPLSVAGFSVWRIDITDGFKFILRDGSWLGIRVSDIEPIVHIFAQSQEQKKLKTLLEAGKNILKGKFK
jgi:phosphomannomutase